MKSPMLPKDHQTAVRRVLALGRSGDPTSLPELVAMLGQTLYQQEGKRLISVFPVDLPRLSVVLTEKLKLFGYSMPRNQEIGA